MQHLKELSVFITAQRKKFVEMIYQLKSKGELPAEDMRRINSSVLGSFAFYDSLASLEFPSHEGYFQQVVKLITTARIRPLMSKVDLLSIRDEELQGQIIQFTHEFYKKISEIIPVALNSPITIFLYGDNKVGKKSLINAFCPAKYNLYRGRRKENSIKLDYQKESLSCELIVDAPDIWDRYYLSGGDIAIILFDITDSKTFTSSRSHYEALRRSSLLLSSWLRYRRSRPNRS